MTTKTRRALEKTLGKLGFGEQQAKGNLSSPPRVEQPSNDPARDPNWQQPFQVLRLKWGEVPTTQSGRIKTTTLLQLSDEELLAEWLRARTDITVGSQFSHRGWYHALYADGMRGKQVLDVGSGFAIDSITFAQHGANLTFVDLVPENLQVVERLCRLFGLEGMQFLLLKEITDLGQLDSDYDVIMAMGSLHHAPSSTIKPEAAELLKHLKINGRWLQLAYPRSRWLKDGSPPFTKWGERTDGVGTPWAEWYDLEKLLRLLSPAEFDTVLTREFHHSEFIWFDLRLNRRTSERTE